MAADDDLRERTGIPRQVLTNRLSTLVGRGVLRREPYRQPGARLRHEYRLTEQGLDLWPVRHRDCGAPVRAVLRCADGHEVTRSRDVVPRPGPGARRRR